MRGKLWVILFLQMMLSAIDLNLRLTDMEGNPINEVAQGVPFLISVNVADAQQDLSEPIIEHLDKLDALERYPITTNITIINGRQKIQKRYRYKGRFDSVGNFAVGPAYYEMNNQLIQSNVVSLRVVKNVSEKRSENVIEDPFVHISVDKTDVYQGEQILLTIRLCFRKALIRFVLEKFSMPQFNVSPLNDPEQGDFEYAGRLWNAITYRFALYPQKSGNLVVPSLTAVAEREKEEESSGFFGHFRSFFGSDIEKIVLQSKPLALKINGLPLDKQVDGIGSFSQFSAAVGKMKLEQATGTTFTVTLVGDGDMHAIALDRLQLPEGMKVYESKRTVSVDAQTGQMSLQKEWILQMLEPGKITIPAQQFSFFDPKTEKYATLKTKQIVLQVVPSVIRPVDLDKMRADAQLKRKKEFSWPTMPIWLLVLLTLLPLMAMIGSYLMRLYRPLIEKIVSYRQFKKRIYDAHQMQNSQMIYKAWEQLFIERLQVSQKERRFVELVLPVLSDELKDRWRVYIARLEQNAFEDKKQQTIDDLYRDTMAWMVCLRGIL